MAATESLLAERTLDQVTVRQILAHANVSTGSFYARFAGKEALIQALWDELRLTVDDFLESPPKRIEDSALRARVKYLIEHRIQRYDKYRGLFRAFSLRAKAGATPLSKDDRKAYLNSQRRLINFFTPAFDEIQHPSPKDAIIMADFSTAAVARELILFPGDPHASTLKYSRKALIHELVRLFEGYLGCKA